MDDSHSFHQISIDGRSALIHHVDGESGKLYIEADLTMLRFPPPKSARPDPVLAPTLSGLISQKPWAMPTPFAEGVSALSKVASKRLKKEQKKRARKRARK